MRRGEGKEHREALERVAGGRLGCRSVKTKVRIAYFPISHSIEYT